MASPVRCPPSLDEAYRIQEAGIARWDDTIAGWKIGMVNPLPMRARLGAERLSGPIFTRDVRLATAGQEIAFPVFIGGFAAVEGEFVFRMGADAPAGKTDWTDADAIALVAALHIGIETAGSPMAAINDLGATVVSSDFGNNYGVILGPEIANWRDRLNDIEVTTFIDGNAVGTGFASVLPGGPIAGLRFLLAHLAARGTPSCAKASSSPAAPSPASTTSSPASTPASASRVAARCSARLSRLKRPPPSGGRRPCRPLMRAAASENNQDLGQLESRVVQHAHKTKTPALHQRRRKSPLGRSLQSRTCSDRRTRIRGRCARS